LEKILCVRQHLAEEKTIVTGARVNARPDDKKGQSDKKSRFREKETEEGERGNMWWQAGAGKPTQFRHRP